MAAATTEQAVVLNIAAMIDLAIGTPEAGVVDFSMLHTVLHCLAQQLRVADKNVELRGHPASLPVGRDYAKSVAISEYAVDTEGKKAEEAIAHPTAATPGTPAAESILIVERFRKPETKEQSKRVETSHAVKQGERTSSSLNQTGSTERLSLVTISKFNVLENTVEDLKERVYGSIPKNEDILEEVRSQTNLKAITDMWTSLNVSSRLEAAEAGIAKLSSLIQDLISDTGGLQDALKEHTSKMSKIQSLEEVSEALQKTESLTNIDEVQHPENIEQSITHESTQASIRESTQTSTHASTHPSSPRVEHQDRVRHGVVDGSPTDSATITPTTEGTIPPAPSVKPEDFAAILLYLQRLHSDLEQLTHEFFEAMSDLKPDMQRPKRLPMPPLRPLSTGKMAPHAADAETATLDEDNSEFDMPVSVADIMTRLIKLERKIRQCCDAVNKNDGVVNDHINSFQDQLEYLSRQVASTQEFTGGKLPTDASKDLPGLIKLFQTVQDMKEELKQVHETALQLAAEKEDRQDRINALIEQIDVLKTIKLDREDMAEAMAEKADLRMLARKVSHDQFELACDDLSRGLDHALGKLNTQEALWQQALDDIQREIEMKLDKMELSPVKEFFNNKLKQLQENLKHIASLRRAVEAAGTKKKLMRDVNCISCDAKVVMPMEAESNIPLSKPLPANLSMKPYLSYELDTIRKTQASNLPQRNLHDWEQIDKHAQQPKAPQKVRSETDKHICNRYCGGSHTMTTPAQRVARLGHFIKQWGPDVLPLSSGLLTGEDGRMYKVSPPEGLDAVKTTGGVSDPPCTPKMPPKKGELPKSPEKRMAIVSAECRCLEDGDRIAKS